MGEIVNLCIMLHISGRTTLAERVYFDPDGAEHGADTAYSLMMHVGCSVCHSE